ncbi:MAG: hypothetical protein JW806_01885 [Sedimentisphaerales bacterium]|nr:hypothetical protein [Sedimentisphaerales bacterium]
MAVSRQSQSSTMLYTAVMFVGLFVITMIGTVVFYLKSEDWRNQYVISQQDQSKFATQTEMRNIGALVGQSQKKGSILGQLLGYIDEMYVLFIGLDPQETSAEVKVSQMKEKYNDALIKLSKEAVFSTDANGPGVAKLLEIYDSKLTQQIELSSQLQSQFDKLNDEYDIARQSSAEQEKALRAKIRTAQEDANNVQQSYDELEELMKQKADEQVQTLMKQRDAAVEDKNKTRQELLETLSKLSITQTRLEEALSRLDVLKPRPKEDIAAYQPDGQVITVDNATNVVFIDIGRQDKVYAGLTFSVYDKNAPIPTDGSSKAEIEVFNVDQNTAIARINKFSKKNPIAEGDIIINLIWDGQAVNRFVVAGDFDFDGDGNVDSDGAMKIKQLVENWGGKVENVVTIDTDFVVLGAPPQVNKKPTLDEIEADPMATDKYEASLKASEQYQEVKAQAKDLFIPVFGVRRFLNFIGYESTASGTRLKVY